MARGLALCVLAVLLRSGVAGEKVGHDLGLRVVLDPRDPEVVEASEWAVRELQRLSDSGIYTTLSLKRVAAAASQHGVFHDNVFVTLELASPYFASERKTEIFEVMIMRHLDDGTRSFAINEFPQMESGAIEEFWIEMVERRRSEREAHFRELEADGGLEGFGHDREERLQEKK